MEDEVGFDILELDDIGLADRGDGVAARAHLSAVDLVAGVDDGDIADHGAALLGEDVQLFTQRTQRDLEVLKDAVGLGLVVEGLLLGALDGVQRLVEHATERGCLVLLDEVAHGGGVQQGLHELAGLPEIEELAVADGVAHLEDAFLLVPVRVGRGPHGNIHLRLLAGENRIHDVLRQPGELVGGLRIPLGPRVRLDPLGGGGLLGRFLGDLLGGLLGSGLGRCLLHDLLLDDFLLGHGLASEQPGG